jgi:hypothetical protein
VLRPKYITCSTYVAAEPFAQKIPDEIQPPLEIRVVLVHTGSERKKQKCKGFGTKESVTKVKYEMRGTLASR